MHASVVAPAPRRGWTPVLAMLETRRAPGETPPRPGAALYSAGGQFQGGPCSTRGRGALCWLAGGRAAGPRGQP